MKSYFKYSLRSLPLTVGIALTLTALCFLVKSYDRGLDLDEEEFWAFIFFFVTGFPLLIWGAHYLSEYKVENESSEEI